MPPRLLRPGAPAPSCSPVSHATDDYNRQHNNKGRHRIWLSMLAAFRTSVRKQKHANSKLINNKTTYPPLRCTSYDPVSVCVQVGVLPKCLNGRAGLWHGCFLRHYPTLYVRKFRYLKAKSLVLALALNLESLKVLSLPRTTLHVHGLGHAVFL